MKKTIDIFFCYAREDEWLLDQLKNHLIALQRQELIDTWHDRNISAGTRRFEEEIGSWTIREESRTHSSGKYDRVLSQRYPGLLVILLDQSASMEQQIEGSKSTKASIATMHVNAIIQRMIDLAGVDEYTGTYKNYAYLSVLRYNDDVYPLLSPLDTPVDIPTLQENPRGFASVTNVVHDEFGNVVRTLVEKRTFWVAPQSQGNTQMAYALERAKKIIETWLNSPPELISQALGSQMPRQKSFPPVIINITGTRYAEDRLEDLEDLVEEIRSLKTENGNVLICNCYLNFAKVQPCFFPTDIRDLEHLSDFKVVAPMFLMSSVIPEVLCRRAEGIMHFDYSQDSLWLIITVPHLSTLRLRSLFLNAGPSRGRL